MLSLLHSQLILLCRLLTDGLELDAIQNLVLGQAWLLVHYLFNLDLEVSHFPSVVVNVAVGIQFMELALCENQYFSFLSPLVPL